jgi:quercetin dioxygenase-like cupin family protein
MIRIESKGDGNGLDWMGSRLFNPVTAKDTDYRLSVQSSVIGPEFQNPAHCHQLEDEYFYITKGGLTFRAGSQTIRAEAGDLVCAVRGVPHQVTNESVEDAEALIFLCPGHIEQAFLEAADDPDNLKEIFSRYGVDFFAPYREDFQPFAWEQQNKAEVRKLPELDTYWMAGDIYTPLINSTETNDQFALVHAVVPPGRGPVPHTHHRDVEMFFILEGRLTLLADDTITTAEAGEVVVLPTGIPHAFRNRSSENVVMLIGTSPGGFDRFVRTVGRPAGDGTPPPPDQQEKERLIEASQHFGVELRPDLLSRLG